MDMTATVTKPRSKKNTTPTVSSETDKRRNENRRLTTVPLSQCRRHPQNRIIDTKSDEFQALVQSIEEHGQREPGRVRLVDGKYEILSGERRFLACKEAGLQSFWCEIVECSDADALGEVALGNVAREDLDPIERAELLELLTREPPDGGGMTREDAGRLFGLNSESGVKNAMRLAKLPGKLRELVRDGRLPERAARAIVPYCASEVVIDAIADLLVKAEADNSYEWGEILAALLASDRKYCPFETEVLDITRPMDKSRKYWRDGMSVWRMFEPTDEQRDELGIVELPVHGEVATNVELWEKLNKPHVDKLKAKQQAKSGGRPTKAETKPEPAKKLSEAEKRKAEALKAKAAEERLNGFTRQWLALYLRSVLGELDSHLVHDVAHSTFGVVAEGLDYKCPLRSMMDATLVELQTDKGKRRIDRILHVDVTTRCWQLILWPVSRLSKGSSGVLKKQGEIPDRLSSIDDRDLWQIVLACAGVGDWWKLATTDGSTQRILFAQWLDAHNKQQLEALRDEMQLTVGGSKLPHSDWVGELLRSHVSGRPWALPERIERVIAEWSKR
jgi:ParB family transcriptional regulator, chromosome partitioning protein